LATPHPGHPVLALTCLGMQRGRVRNSENVPPASVLLALLSAGGAREWACGARGEVLPPVGQCRECLQEQRSRLGEEPRLARLALGCISNQLSETRPPEPEPRNPQPSLPDGRERPQCLEQREVADCHGKTRLPKASPPRLQLEQPPWFQRAGERPGASAGPWFCSSARSGRAGLVGTSCQPASLFNGREEPDGSLRLGGKVEAQGPGCKTALLLGGGSRGF
jgi:hypothetical protein